MNVFFSKNHKKHKTNFKKSIFFKNEAGYMFGLTYAFSRNFVLQFQFTKNYFRNFGQSLKCAWESGDGGGDGDCDRHGEF